VIKGSSFALLRVFFPVSRISPKAHAILRTPAAPPAFKPGCVAKAVMSPDSALLANSVNNIFWHHLEPSGTFWHHLERSQRSGWKSRKKLCYPARAGTLFFDNLGMDRTLWFRRLGAILACGALVSAIASWSAAALRRFLTVAEDMLPFHAFWAPRSLRETLPSQKRILVKKR
jgi:hypothetical protein